MKKQIFSIVAAMTGVLIGIRAAADQKVIGLPDPSIVGANEQQPFTGVYSYQNGTTPDLQYYYGNAGLSDERDVYSMGYGGHDMWGGNEGYTYVYLQSGFSKFSLSGELEICNDAENLNCGIMIRNDYRVKAEAGDDGYCLCFNYRKNSAGDHFWNVNGRKVQGGIDNICTEAAYGDDNRCWMKAERDGNTFYFYYRESADVEWTLFYTFVDDDNIFNDKVYAGIYMCAGSGGGWSNFRGVKYEYTKEEGDVDPPSMVSVTKGVGEAKVSWGASPTAKSYRIERRIGNEAEWTVLGTVDTEPLEYVDPSPARDGTMCYYRVVAVGDSSETASGALSSRFFEYGDGTGLNAMYYEFDENDVPTLKATTTEPILNFPWNSQGGVGGCITGKFRAVFTGTLLVPYTGNYTFFWGINNDIHESLSVMIGDSIRFSGAQGAEFRAMNLSQGTYPITVVVEGPSAINSWFHLSWEEAEFIVRDPSTGINPIPASQYFPDRTLGAIPEGWNWSTAGELATAVVDYDTSAGSYRVDYASHDMWDVHENFVYIWHPVTRESFDFSFKYDNASPTANYKCGAMIRAGMDLGVPCLTFNHRLAESYQFYFLDVNGRQSAVEGTGITDHKTGTGEDGQPDPVVERTGYMKISRRGKTYTFWSRTTAEEEWTLFDTFEDTDGILGKRPFIGLTAFGNGSAAVQTAIFSEVSFAERSMGTIVTVR